MHHTQDFIFAIGSVIFTLALFPSLRSMHKPAAATSLITAVVLLVFAINYATLSLWFSVVAASGNAVVWLALAWQKYNQ